MDINALVTRSGVVMFPLPKTVAVELWSSFSLLPNEETIRLTADDLLQTVKFSGSPVHPALSPLPLAPSDPSPEPQGEAGGLQVSSSQLTQPNTFRASCPSFLVTWTDLSQQPLSVLKFCFNNLSTVSYILTSKI